MNLEKNLFYSKEHEWIKVEGDIAYIGISDFAQNALGSIVFVELPEIDDEFSVGDVFGAVESVKAASDMYIPVGGTIINVNEELVDAPELVNEDCYKNWIICIKLSNGDEVKELMNAEEYELTCSKEA